MLRMLEINKWIIGLENQFLVFLRVAVLHRFYCSINYTQILIKKSGRKFIFSIHDVKPNELIYVKRALLSLDTNTNRQPPS